MSGAAPVVNPVVDQAAVAGANPAPAQQPIVVKVNTFVQENHDKVIAFLEKFDPTPFIKAPVQPAPVQPSVPPAAPTQFEPVWRVAHLVVAVFATAAAVFAFLRGYKLPAAGAGAAGLVALYKAYNPGIETEAYKTYKKEQDAAKKAADEAQQAFDKESADFNTSFGSFAANVDATVEHLTAAYNEKAGFMISQVNNGGKGWKVVHDQDLSKSYDNSIGKSIVEKLITDEQKAWRVVHTALVAAVKDKNFAPIQDGSSELNALLEKLTKARDQIVFGKKDSTYVSYDEKGVASVWA